MISLARAAVLITALIAVIPLSASAQDLAAEDAAYSLFVQGKRDEAYVRLSTLARDPKASARVFLYKGLIERDREQLDAAVESLQQGHARDPKELSIMLELAVTLSWRGDTAEAQAMYERALALDPENTGALAGRARMQSWLGDYDAARAGFSALRAKHPDNQEAIDGLAALERVRTTHIAAWGGILDTDAATIDAIFGASLAHDFTPRFTGQVGYRSEGVEVARDLSLVGTSSRSTVHKASAIAIWRPSSTLTLNGGYEASVSDVGLDHAFDLGAGLRASELLTFIGGVRVYAQQGFGMLDHAGVVVSHMADSYVMLQGFRYDDFVRDFSNSGVLTVRQSLIADVLAVKVAGGYGYHTRTGTQKSMLAAIDLGVIGDLTFTLEYQYFTASFFRHQATAGLRYDFP
jgi:tetratricopeptide (TPR) repeat protein